MIDYRELLKKYIEHVGNVEGSTFLGWLGTSMSGVSFSEEEKAELRKIDEEIMQR